MKQWKKFKEEKQNNLYVRPIFNFPSNSFDYKKGFDIFSFFWQLNRKNITFFSQTISQIKKKIFFNIATKENWFHNFQEKFLEIFWENSEKYQELFGKSRKFSGNFRKKLSQNRFFLALQKWILMFVDVFLLSLLWEQTNKDIKCDHQVVSSLHQPFFSSLCQDNL